jgi:hypothetical protein
MAHHDVVWEARFLPGLIRVVITALSIFFVVTYMNIEMPGVTGDDDTPMFAIGTLDR